MNFFINFSKALNKVDLVSDNGATMSYTNAVVKENAINERVYIVSSLDDQQEFASLPLVITIIMTNYDTKHSSDSTAN